MVGKRCFFIGHRNTPERVLSLLILEVERHITEYDVSEFYVGHYGRFDSMAAQAVKQVKKKYPEIKLILLLPYHPFNQVIQTPEGFDGTFYPTGMEAVPKRFAIVKANQYMVNSSTHVIAYVNHFMGGSGKLLEYAEKRQKRNLLIIKNLANCLEQKKF